MRECFLSAKAKNTVTIFYSQERQPSLEAHPRNDDLRGELETQESDQLNGRSVIVIVLSQSQVRQQIVRQRYHDVVKSGNLQSINPARGKQAKQLTIGYV